MFLLNDEDRLERPESRSVSHFTTSQDDRIDNNDFRRLDNLYHYPLIFQKLFLNLTEPQEVTNNILILCFRHFLQQWHKELQRYTQRIYDSEISEGWARGERELYERCKLLSKKIAFNHLCGNIYPYKIMSGQPKNSSLSTILAMFNNMLGGALLSFPVLFKRKGVISSAIVVVISAIISFLTCRIYVLHSKKKEKDIQESIIRLLGKKWEVYFSFISGLYIVLLNIISLDLIVDQLYSIIYFFFESNNSAETIAPKDSLEFGRFSVQWLTLILFMPLMVLCSIKNFNLMVKLSEYGSAAIFVYMIYVIIQFFVSLFQGSIDTSQMEWFTFDIASLAGTSSLAFTIHTVVNAFIKQNKNEAKNERDLGITYLSACVTYLTVSIAGSFAISNKHCTNTLIDCYLTDWTILFVEVTYLLGRICAFPIMVDISRTRLIKIFYEEATEKRFKVFNILFMVFGSIISILSPKLPLSTLISIVGAVVCFFFIYFFPAKMHFACLYPAKAKKDEENSLIDGSTLVEDEDEACSCNHSPSYADKRSKIFRQVLYGALNMVGVAVGVFGLIFSIKDIIGE